MLEELKNRLREHEGVIPYMYLDTLGYVTTGVGHLLATVVDAMAVPFRLPSGSVATAVDIRAEYQAMRQLEPARLPRYYATFAKLKLMPSDIAALLDADIAKMSKSLVISLPEFPSYPESAQEALLDMAFQLGPSGLIHKFPKMIAAVHARDWAACASECGREGIQEWRNTATANLFKASVAA